MKITLFGVKVADGLTLAAAVALFLVLGALIYLFMGWLVMLVLGAFGVGWGFWPCVGVTTAVSILIGMVKS